MTTVLILAVREHPGENMEDRLWKLQQDVNELDKKMLLVARKIDDLEGRILLGSDDPLQSSVRKLRDKGVSVENKLRMLTNKVDEVAKTVNQLIDQFEPLPQTNLISESLLDRALAVVGHLLLGWTAISFVLAIFSVVIAAVFGLLGN